jgi:hypothetical protein
LYSKYIYELFQEKRGTGTFHYKIQGVDCEQPSLVAITGVGINIRDIGITLLFFSINGTVLFKSYTTKAGGRISGLFSKMNSVK